MRFVHTLVAALVLTGTSASADIPINGTMFPRNNGYPIVRGPVQILALDFVNFPAASSLPAGTLLAASDQNFALYMSNGSAWVVQAAGTGSAFVVSLFGATSFTSTAELRLQTNIAGGIAFLRVQPNDGFNGSWTCDFGEASNVPATPPVPDAQVGCGWNKSSNPDFNPARGSMSWNMETHCALGTGCADFTKQAEWYDVFAPPIPDSTTPWQANHAYVGGDFVTNDGGKIYVANNDGTSGNAGGPTGGTTLNLLDGSVQWTYYAGFRTRTYNGRLLDGYLSSSYVASNVGIGNAHDINGPFEFQAVNGVAFMMGFDNENSIIVPNFTADRQPIGFWADASFMHAPAMELSSERGGVDGNLGLGLRVGIHSIGGDGTLTIGTPTLRFKDVNVTKIVSIGNTPNDPGACSAQGLMVNTPTDSATYSGQAWFCNNGPVTPVSGLGGPRWQSLGAWEGYGEDRFNAVGNGTFDMGHPICSTYATAPGGSFMAAEIFAEVSDILDGVYTAIKVATTLVGSALGTSTLVYRTTTYDSGNGTKFTVGFRTGGAGNLCLIPTITVSDGRTYGGKWTITAVAHTD
jgi:hypothetical protein